MKSKEILNKMNEQRNWAIKRCNPIIDKIINREILLNSFVDFSFQMRSLNVNVMRDLLNET
jgi:hypothetical protein